MQCSLQHNQPPPHNKTANKYMMQKQQRSGGAANKLYGVEKDGDKYRCEFHITVAASGELSERLAGSDADKTVTIRGPRRPQMVEAELDGEEMTRQYKAHGQEMVRRVSRDLFNRTWTDSEIFAFRNGTAVGMKSSKAPDAEERIQPIGDGWAKAASNRDWLEHAPSQVLFCSKGDKVGTYMKHCPTKRDWVECDRPHIETTKPWRLSAASHVKGEPKMDMAVQLNDLTKIARLALKIPMGFLDNPSAAYALFQGVRNKAGAEHCAKTFHTKLLPLMQKNIHGWTGDQLEKALKKALIEVDEDLRAGQTCFAGASAVVALAVGDQVAVASVGQARAVLVYGKEKQPAVARELVKPTSVLVGDEEVKNRAREAGAVVVGDQAFAPYTKRKNVPRETNEVQRILAAENAFAVLDGEDGFYLDAAKVKSCYRKLALKVHPDKVPDDEKVDAQAAFAKLEAASSGVEALSANEASACKEVYRVLTSGSPFCREVAGSLLQVAASTTHKGEIQAQHERVQGFLSRITGDAYELGRAAARKCQIAADLLASSPVPTTSESHMEVGVPCLNMIGCRDFRDLGIASRELQVDTASFSFNEFSVGSIVMMTGLASTIPLDSIKKTAGNFPTMPKAQCLSLFNEFPGAKDARGLMSILMETLEKRSTEPAWKRAKTEGKEGQVRVRHILLKHTSLKATADPMAKMPMPAAAKKRTLDEAEQQLLKLLPILLKEPQKWPQYVRQMSECQSSLAPAAMAGDLGWFAASTAGSQDPAIVQAAFQLEVGQTSDVVSSSRGLHLLNRMG